MILNLNTEHEITECNDKLYSMLKLESEPKLINRSMQLNLNVRELLITFIKTYELCVYPPHREDLIYPTKV